jgi:hypothetical protein
MSKKSTLIALIIGCAILCASFGCGEAPPPAPTAQIDIASRSFYMGFTNWPPEATVEGVAQAHQFIADHGDLFAYQIDNGVPWPEALADAEFSSAVMEGWRSTRESIPKGHTLFVSINCLDDSRVNLAKYWGETDGMDLPAPWNTYNLDNKDVKTAYLNYAKRVVDFFKPDYFAIGIEVNVSINDAPETWTAYKELHKHVYTELKALHPSLPIFATFTHSHMKGMDGADKDTQRKEIVELLAYCDLLGLSAYPYGWSYWPSGKEDPVSESFFDVPLSFGKPIAVTETGAPSQNFKALGINYKFTEDYQYQYIDLLLRKANEYKFAFVVNWTSIDFEKLLDVFPKEAREIGMIWAYTGLQRSDGQPKKALSLWDTYLDIPHSRLSD